MNSYIKLLKKGLFTLMLLNLVQIAQASERDLVFYGDPSSDRTKSHPHNAHLRGHSPMRRRSMQLPVHQDFGSSSSAASSLAKAAAPLATSVSSAAAAAAVTAFVTASSAKSSAVSVDDFTPSLATAQDREKSDSESDTDGSDSIDRSLFSRKFLTQLQSLNPQQAKVLNDQAALLTQQFKNYTRKSSSAAPAPASAPRVSSLARSAAAKSSSSQSASSLSTPAPTPATLALPFNRSSVTGTAIKRVQFADEKAELDKAKTDKVKPDNAPKNALDQKHTQPKNNSASTATAQNTQHEEIAHFLASIASAVKFVAPTKREVAQRHLLAIAGCHEQTYESQFKTTPDDEHRTKAIIDFVQKKFAQLDPTALQEKHTRIKKCLEILRGQSTPTAAPAATASAASATSSGQSSRPNQHVSPSAKSKMETAARAASSSQAAAATQSKPQLTAAEIGKASQIAKIKARLDLIAKNGAQHATSAQIKSDLEAITATACGFTQVGKIDDLCQIIFEALHTKSTQELNALAQPISAIAQKFRAPNAAQKPRVRSYA